MELITKQVWWQYVRVYIDIYSKLRPGSVRSRCFRSWMPGPPSTAILHAGILPKAGEDFLVTTIPTGTQDSCVALEGNSGFHVSLLVHPWEARPHQRHRVSDLILGTLRKFGSRKPSSPFANSPFLLLRTWTLPRCPKL